MIVSQSVLDTFSSQAKLPSRQRMNYDLRNSEEDNSQWMLNILESGMVLYEAKDVAWEPLADADILR